MSYKEDSFSLPLTLIGGEQKQEKKSFDIEKFKLTSDKTFIDEIEADERDEKFIYAYSDSGLSENLRDWSPEIMQSIGDQVVEKMPVGYLGHIKPSDYGYEFPEPQIVWFGSYTEDIDKKSVRLWLKGYLLPTAEKLETWIKTKAVNSISVYGKISYKMEKEIMSIKDIDLKSIDISRKLGEGLNSSIVGLHGEMSKDATYEDARCLLEQHVKGKVKDSPEDFGFKISAVTLNEPYIWVWVKKMYISDDKAILQLEYSNDRKVFEVDYSINEDNTVEISSYEEVVEKTIYKKKQTKTLKGETTIKGEMEEKDMPMNITLEDVIKDKSLYGQIKAQIASEMSEEEGSKVLATKAGEMDQISAIFGGEQTDIVSAVRKTISFNAKFVGEMSAIFCGEADEDMTPDEIVDKAKETVEALTEIKDAVNANDTDDVVEKVKDVVDTATEAEFEVALVEVSDAFDEKTKDIKNEVLLEFIKDDFDYILNPDTDDIDDVDAWKKEALEALEEDFDEIVERLEKRFEKLGKKSKAVGEMNAFANFSSNTGVGATTGVKDEDPDIAEVRRLGYID